MRPRSGVEAVKELQEVHVAGRMDVWNAAEPPAPHGGELTTKVEQFPVPVADSSNPSAAYLRVPCEPLVKIPPDSEM